MNDEMTVSCPYCGAGIGEGCVAYPGGLIGLPVPTGRAHKARSAAALLQETAPAPEVGEPGPWQEVGEEGGVWVR